MSQNTVFRPLGVWPDTPTPHRRGRRTFSAPWSNTLDLLHRELDHLGAQNVVIQADFREQDIRLDGLPRSNAPSPQHPGVIVSFESIHGPLQYRTDAHEFWQHNVRAIALGLEALRAVDRYGITKTGQQYTGWRQLTAGSGVTSRQKAIELVAGLVGVGMTLNQWDDATPEARKSVYRRALLRAHPDQGGNTDKLSAVRDAGRLLEVA